MKAKENLRRESVGRWEKVLMAYERFVVLPKTSHLGHGEEDGYGLATETFHC